MTFDQEEQTGSHVADCIVVLGDSTSSGFGTGRHGYPVLLGETLQATRVENLAKFGQTTKSMVEEDLPRMAALRPDVVVVQAGMGDSLPHPGQRVQGLLERFVPSTWHGVDGLERRAYLSGTRRRRARQWLVAECKTALKRTLIFLTGGFTRATPEEFGTYLDRLLTGLEAICPVVVCIGLFDIDQHVFPKQHQLNVPFRAQRQRVLADHPRVIPVEIDQQLDRWDDFLEDHGHFNAAGHATVARAIILTLQSDVPGLAMAGHEARTT